MNLRKIHLLTSLFVLPFLLAFAISAIEFAHRTWIAHPVRVLEEHRTLSPGITDARILARQWRGELDDIEAPTGSLKFRVATPLGATYDVDYSIATGETTIKTATPSFLTTLAFLHISHGIWAYVTPAVSAGLLMLGLTGLYLWFKNRQERRIGLALLLLGAGIPIGLIISMRLS